MFDKDGKLIPDEDYPVFVDWSNEFNKDTAGQAEMIYVLKQFIFQTERFKGGRVRRRFGCYNRIGKYGLPFW